MRYLLTEVGKNGFYYRRFEACAALRGVDPGAGDASERDLGAAAQKGSGQAGRRAVVPDDCREHGAGGDLSAAILLRPEPGPGFCAAGADRDGAGASDLLCLLGEVFRRRKQARTDG